MRLSAGGSTCVVWLLKYLKMGNETLLRTGTRGKDTHPNELEKGGKWDQL